MIGFDGGNGGDPGPADRVEVVAGKAVRAGSLRSRNQVLDLYGDRIETSRGDDVAGERIPHYLSADDALGAGIVDIVFANCPAERIRGQIRLRRQDGAKIARSEGGNGYGLCRSLKNLVLTELLPIEEEERLIVAVVELAEPHRPT